MRSDVVFGGGCFVLFKLRKVGYQGRVHAATSDFERIKGEPQCFFQPFCFLSPHSTLAFLPIQRGIAALTLIVPVSLLSVQRKPPERAPLGAKKEKMGSFLLCCRGLALGLHHRLHFLRRRGPC